MHSVAMGYIPRENSSNSGHNDMVALANASFPVPSSVHSTFQDLLRIQQQAKFDCFKEPSASWQCYKCVTYWGRLNSELDYFEKMYDNKIEAKMLESDSEDDQKPKAVFNVSSSTFSVPNDNSDFKLGTKNVAHFYVGLPAYTIHQHLHVLLLCMIFQWVRMVKLRHKNVGSRCNKWHLQDWVSDFFSRDTNKK